MKTFLIKSGKKQKVVDSTDPYGELRKLNKGSMKVSSTITPIKNGK